MRQAATKDEWPRKIAKITKIEEYKLLSLCSLRSFVAKRFLIARLFGIALRSAEMALNGVGED